MQTFVSIKIPIRRLFGIRHGVLIQNPLFKLTYDSQDLRINQRKLQLLNISDTHLHVKGDIPSRWGSMIQDFHWPDILLHPRSQQEETPIETDETPLRIRVSNSIERVLPGGWHTPNIPYPDDYWGTYDGQFTPYTKRILETCSQFKSTPTYHPLAALEGGITIHHDNHPTQCYEDVRGIQSYRANKRVNREELTCLYLALKHCNVNVSVIP